MVDFDLKKSMGEKLSFKAVFIELLVYSFSLFLALQWSELVKDTLNTIFPAGSNLINKFMINGITTVIIVLFIFLLLHGNKFKNKEIQTIIGNSNEDTGRGIGQEKP
jgi:glycerol uptake facilitator-like aquaporin